MSKYTIVDKDKKGNQQGQKYTITYQIKDTGYTRHLIDLFCYAQEDDGTYKYCYISGNDGYGVNTTEERTEFLKEFYEFQKGGSYRKTHPINMSNVEVLQEQLKAQKDIVKDLENQIYNAKQEEKKTIMEHYYDDIDLEDVNNYVNGIEKAISKNKNYYISGIQYHIWEGHRIYIYSKDTNKKVKVITVKDGNIVSRNIEETDLEI